MNHLNALNKDYCVIPPASNIQGSSQVYSNDGEILNKARRAASQAFEKEKLGSEQENVTQIPRSVIPPTQNKESFPFPINNIRGVENTMEKSYSFNSEKNLVYFYPSKKEWTKKLDPLEWFYCTLFPKGALYFKGKISIEKFLKAMHDTLQHFDCLYGRINREQGQLYVSYSGKETEFVQLEIEEKKEAKIDIPLESLYPSKIDKRLSAFPVNDCEGLPVGVFKLTIFEDGFAIGYCLNHAFFDQSSVVYFFKCLSQIYTESDNSPSLKEPAIVNTASLVPEDPVIYRDVEEFRKHAERLGMKYLSDKSELFAKFATLPSGQAVNLRFNPSGIEELKATSKLFISTNDIIQAILIKIYSMNFVESLGQKFTLAYACNMRKRCGLGEEQIGNLVNVGRMELTIEDIVRLTVLDLAIISRESLNKIHAEDFKKMLNWFLHLQKFNENPSDYIPLAFLDPHFWLVTNWSSFNYEEIRFEGEAPLSIKTSFVPVINGGVVSFDHIEGEKKLDISVLVPTNYLNTIIEWGKNTKLFDTQFLS